MICTNQREFHFSRGRMMAISLKKLTAPTVEANSESVLWGLPLFFLNLGLIPRSWGFGWFRGKKGRIGEDTEIDVRPGSFGGESELIDLRSLWRFERGGISEFAEDRQRCTPDSWGRVCAPVETYPLSKSVEFLKTRTSFCGKWLLYQNYVLVLKNSTELRTR